MQRQEHPSTFAVDRAPCRQWEQYNSVLVKMPSIAVVETLKLRCIPYLLWVVSAIPHLQDADLDPRYSFPTLGQQTLFREIAFVISLEVDKLEVGQRNAAA